MPLFVLLLLLSIFGVQCGSVNVSATSNFVTKETITETLSNVGKDSQQNRESRESAVAKTTQDPLIIVSTLDGELIALDKYKGTVKWRIKEKPIIQTSVLKTPFTLPDPTDGTVYVFGPRNTDGAMDLMKKLSLNIPELVAKSPTRSSVDNSLCTGSKSGVWYVIDPDTGQKMEEISHDRTVTYCPMMRQYKRALYVGRTEYKLVVLDAESKEIKWNITYSDYSAHAVDETKEYDLKHLSSSQDGLLVTLKAKTNELLWTAELGSTVVTAFQLSWSDLTLHRVPIFRFGGETLTHMLAEMNESGQDFLRGGTMFRSTLYVGSAESGLYALPSITHDKVPVRGSLDFVGLPLITSEHSLPAGSRHNLVGYYQPLLGTTAPSRVSHNHRLADQSSAADVIAMPGGSRATQVFGEVSGAPPSSLWERLLMTLGLVLLLGFLCLAVMFAIRLCMRKSERWLRAMVSEALVREKQKEQDSAGRLSDSSHSRNGNGSSGANGSLRPWSSDGPSAFSEQLTVHEDWVRVGKIQFDSKAILGRGCEGTTVFSGEYDQRAVAVKRMLPECLSIADREVALLRESDQHPNVLRYYCTEQDFQFRYIALDLCHGTLKDFAEHPCAESHFGLTAREALFQASSGLAHLHSLDIVHRDLKPANVLLRRAAGQAGYQVVISDFGLCKKLSPGRGSFSRQSGLRGTEGWIAPEMVRDDGGRMTFSVDIFSLGCVFYYVLSRGSHPFGDSYSRQTNILSNHYRLDRISSAEQVAHDLIETMITPEASERPNINVVLKHPFFWNKDRQLHFFQEVSDRIEKLPVSDPLCEAIETDSHLIIGGDWTRFISRALADDLRRFRTYQGWRIVDLIRAIRNKKHHFRELAPALQAELGGGSPHRYISYFLDRFPLLLPSVYDAVRCVCGEDIFRGFYDESEWRRTSPRARRRLQRSRLPPSVMHGAAGTDLDWRGDAFRRYGGPPQLPKSAAGAPPPPPPKEQQEEEEVKAEPAAVPDEPAEPATVEAAAEEEARRSSDEEPWIDISRPNRRQRVRVRKKKKKKRLRPLHATNAAASAAGEAPDEGAEEGEEEEADEDEEEEEEGEA